MPGGASRSPTCRACPSRRRSRATTSACGNAATSFRHVRSNQVSSPPPMRTTTDGTDRNAVTWRRPRGIEPGDEGLGATCGRRPRRWRRSRPSRGRGRGGPRSSPGARRTAGGRTAPAPVRRARPAARRGRAPQGQPTVAVVVVEVHDERLLAAHEPGRAAVAQPLGGLGQGEARLPDPGQRLGRLGIARVTGRPPGAPRRARPRGGGSRATPGPGGSPPPRRSVSW